MKRNYVVALLLFVWLVCATNAVVAQPGKDSNSVLGVEQLREDFTLLRSALEEAHPGLYRYTPKAVFDAKFDSTYATLNQPQSVQDFYRAVKPLITLIRCGHTKFMPRGEYNYWFHTDQLFPLMLYFTTEKAYILGSFQEIQAELAGAEVVAINGVPMQEIRERLLPYISFADGMVQSSKYMELSKYFSGYYAAVFGGIPSFAVTYKDASGKVITTSYSATSLEHVKASVEVQNQQAFSLTFNKDNVAILRIGLLMNSDKQKFKKFVAGAFKDIQKQKPKALIIDVRSNEGGMDSYGMLLSSYLAEKPYTYYSHVISKSNKKYSFSDRAFEPWFYGYFRSRMKPNNQNTFDVQPAKYLKVLKPQRNAYKGDTYILTNGWSYSATAEFASVVHHMGRATFVGQETGGAYQGNNSGYFSILPLPNSKITLGIPLWSYYTAVQDASNKSRGTTPHHFVEPSAQDILSGTDRELTYTLELIQQKAAHLKAESK